MDVSKRARGSPGARRAPSAAAASAAAADLARASHEVGETFAVPGLQLTDHTFRVPLDHGAPPGGPSLCLFAREAVAPARAGTDQPYLLFLTGGPGFEAPRPTSSSAWLKAAVAHFRVVLLDQRGTGRSSPVSADLLATLGGPEAQAAYLSLFRADSIVRDAEAVRSVLVPPAGQQRGRWSVLGQSFGGFCAVTYLSLAPEGLTEVLIAGGLPPDVTLPCSADAAYAALLARVSAQNAKFYARYPGDRERVRGVAAALAACPGGGAPLPSGGILTPRGLQLLGLPCLGLGGGFDRLHYLLERALDPPGLGGEGGSGGGLGAPRRVSRAFLRGFEALMAWDTNPLYAVLHESIYANGGGPTAWAAERALAADPARAAAFDASASLAEGRDILFLGEMVFPWMFDEVAALAPLAGVAATLAARADWPRLYDPAALAANRVPVAAAVYWEDMYVDFDLSQATARTVRGLRQWVTNEFLHSGIRDDGGRVFDGLLGLVRGSAPLV